MVVFNSNSDPGYRHDWYVVNSKIGALTYNLFHHKGLAIVMYVAGIYIFDEVLQLIGVILFAHAALDRVFGYGLKY